MLDVNRLFGIVFHASKSDALVAMKEALTELTTKFDPDDVAIVMGEYEQGSGAATANIMNMSPFKQQEDFLNMATAVANVIAESDINSPKFVFIISDDFSGKAAFELTKIKMFNENCCYPANLNFIQYHPKARSEDWIVVRSLEQLKKEIKNAAQ